MPTRAPRRPGGEHSSAGRRGRARPVLLLTPYSLDGNPYVRLLVGSLRERGVEVEIARGRSPLVLWRALLRHGIPRVVHVQWHHPYLTADALPVAMVRTALFFAQWATLRALGARFVWTIHNLVEHERRHVRWELFACRLLVRAVDAPVVHCEAAAAEAAAAYRVPAGRMRVVPHGVFKVSGAPDRAAVRASLGLADDELLLVNFGRVRRYKGIDRLLDAFGRIEASNLRLAVVGFADDVLFAEALERQASADPRVTLRFEEVDDEELSQLLCACDAAVLPYRESLTSGAAVLAASHGRAVIAPRLGCLKELPDEAAILYDPDTAGALARALETAVAAPLPAMGARARDHIARFPWDHVARSTHEIYRSVSSAADIADGDVSR